jgi:soluble lytic murein transglycosylase-like protein
MRLVTDESAWPLALHFGQQNGLDPALIMAVIRQESDFDENAINPERGDSPSRGLMQLQWPTARLVAKEIGLSLFGPENLFDPETNVALGSKYLADQIGTYGGLERGVSAYNAGRPISDNAKYVSNVLRYMAQYQAQEALPLIYPPREPSVEALSSGPSTPAMIGTAAVVGIVLALGLAMLVIRQ